MHDVSRRQLILAALLTRAGSITVENGYATDAGARVFLGEEVQLGEDDPPSAIALVVQDSVPTQSTGYIDEPLDVEVQALVRADLEQPHIAAEVLLADIKHAFETGDRTLGSLLKGEMTLGPTRVVPRQPGALTVGVGVTYRTRFLRQWGSR